jgi:hypothetical protein
MPYWLAEALLTALIVFIPITAWVVMSNFVAAFKGNTGGAEPKKIPTWIRVACVIAAVVIWFLVQAYFVHIGMR